MKNMISIDKFFIAVGLALVSYYFINNKQPEPVPVTERYESLAKKIVEEKKQQLPKLEPEKVAKVKAFLKDHKGRLTQVDSNPDATQEQLEQTAKNFTSSEIQFLKLKAIDEDESNDGRFLAVYLLGLANHPESAAALKQIILHPIGVSRMYNRLYSDEIIIRTQAIESISKKWSKNKKQQLLNELLLRTDNTSIANWARRHLN